MITVQLTEKQAEVAQIALNDYIINIARFVARNDEMRLCREALDAIAEAMKEKAE